MACFLNHPSCIRSVPGVTNMLRILSFSFALLAGAVAAQTEELVVDLSQNHVAITADYSGSEIFVFGAIKRDHPLPEGTAPLEVAIVVEGPLEPVTVRRKEKKLGIWVNAASVEVEEAPSFFAVATTGPLDEILTESMQADYAIGIDHAVRRLAHDSDNPDMESFNEAVTRIRVDSGLYSERDGIVHLTDETLFRASIQLPANLVEGDFSAKVFLIRDRNVISQTTVGIEVRKTGLERWLYNLAQDQALLYGLMSLLVALVAGYGASELFRLLKR